MPLPSKCGFALALAIVALAVGVSRHAGPLPDRPTRPDPVVIIEGPPSVLIAPGSVEARVRWLEGRMIEMQARLDSEDRR